MFDMGNALVRNVIASIVLVILCIVIGVQAAESAKVSVGIIVALLGVVFLIWMGPRVWTLIYLVPPVLTLIPIPGKLGTLPTMFLVSGVVLFYWIVMWVMGYVRFRWRSLWVMDLLVLVVFCYMVASYIRHPVSMAIFGYDAEYVGGKEYVWCITATVHYLALSLIPCSHEQVRTVMWWGVKLSLVACFFGLFLSLSGLRGGVDITEVAEVAQGTRFGMFVPLSMYIIYFIYGRYPIMQVLTKPSYLMACLLALVGITLSGAREVLVGKCFVIAAIGVVKRELWCLTVLGLLTYGGILYLSSEGIVKTWPYGIQRCFHVLPGVEIDEEIERSTTHSSEWRIEMWKWALDKRTGYIQDYVWGDGFGQSVDYLRRETTSMMRGTTVFGDQDYFARTGTWHSGVITTIHRLGYVGLGIVVVFCLCGVFLFFQVCIALKGTSLYIPCLFYTVTVADECPMYFISAGALPLFFRMYVYVSFVKLLYCVAREQGRIVPLLQRRRYVPILIQEHNAA